MQHIQIGYIENIMWVYNKITKFPNFTETIKMLLKYLQLFVSLYGYNSQGVSRKKKYVENSGQRKISFFFSEFMNGHCLKPRTLRVIYVLYMYLFCQGSWFNFGEIAINTTFYEKSPQYMNMIVCVLVSVIQFRSC